MGANELAECVNLPEIRWGMKDPAEPSCEKDPAEPGF